MPIRYKIVTRRTRRSCVVGLRTGDSSLVYKAGTVVKALEGSLGIFTFKRRMDATSWPYYRDRVELLEILRVNAHGRGRKPKRIIKFTSDVYSMLARLLDGDTSEWAAGGVSAFTLVPPPRGTLCYPSVEVLD